MSFPISSVRGGHAPPYLRGVAAAEEDGHSTTYSDIVVAAGPILYWPLWESAGVIAEELISDAHGTYSVDVSTLGTEAGIGDDNTAVTFGGTPAYVDIYSAVLDAAWDGDEFTLMACCKYSLAVSQDGTARRVLRMIADGDNKTMLSKSSTEGEFALSREASGLYKAMWVSGLEDVGWQHFALTMSFSNFRQKGYRNAVEEDEESALLFEWQEVNFGADTVLIGAEDKTPANYWKGGICHVAIFSQELSVETLLSLIPPGIT